MIFFFFGSEVGSLFGPKWVQVLYMGWESTHSLARGGSIYFCRVGSQLIGESEVDSLSGPRWASFFHASEVDLLLDPKWAFILLSWESTQYLVQGRFKLYSWVGSQFTV